MNDEPVVRLFTHDGRLSLGAELTSLLRAGAYAEAEQSLAAHLRALPGPVASACLATTTDAVAVTGWDELNADLVRLGRKGHVITAVGLDLSNYNDSATDDWWDKDPCVEFSAYTDQPFPFSTASVEEMLGASAEYAAPWTGSVLGQEETVLEVRGLRGVNGAVLRHEEERGRAVESTEDAATFLGWWWQHLRFRQALVRHLDGDGLALTVPVLAGSHDVGPWLVTVHPVTKVADHQATTTALLDARARLHLANYERATREIVGELRELRENTRAGWGFRNRDKRKKFVKYADARLALTCDIAGLPAQKGSIARMSDQYFEDLMAAFVASREERARLTADQPPG